MLHGHVAIVGDGQLLVVAIGPITLVAHHGRAEPPEPAADEQQPERRAGTAPPSGARPPSRRVYAADRGAGRRPTGAAGDPVGPIGVGAVD